MIKLVIKGNNTIKRLEKSFQFKKADWTLFQEIMMQRDDERGGPRVW
jgi:hypothetical protein